MQRTLGSLRDPHNNHPRSASIDEQIHPTNKLLNRNLTDPARLPRTPKPPLRQRNSPQISKAPSPHPIHTTARPCQNQHPNTRTGPVATHQHSLDTILRLAPRQHTLFTHRETPTTTASSRLDYPLLTASPMIANETTPRRINASHSIQFILSER